MGFAKEDDYIDYTLLKKKGILKVKENEIKRKIKMAGDFIDFTSFNMDNKSTNNNPLENVNSNVNNNLSFLTDMASANSGRVSNPVVNAINNELKIDGKEFNALKIKIDDIEYKLNRFIERIDRLESQLDNLKK